MYQVTIKNNLRSLVIGGALSVSLAINVASAAGEYGAPVPGYVPPMTITQTPDYADDTRGVFVPSHDQYRLKTGYELGNYKKMHDSVTNREMNIGNAPLYAQATPNNDIYERELNRISSGHLGYEKELNRIASDQGMVTGSNVPQLPAVHGGEMNIQYNQQSIADMPRNAPSNMMVSPNAGRIIGGSSNGGVEIAIGDVSKRSLDMANSLVKLREERVSIRRALQRMMDQIGAGDWTIVWDLAEQNSGLPEMEISIFAEEPFMNVLNALLARVQTRSGQPLRVIRYDNTSRLIITDRTGGHRLAGKTSPVGVGEVKDVAVTENVLKEAMVSLHYDEIPLVDALENIVNQSGKGEWRLRVYAGMDQVLKPAHIEEPFAVAIERLLKLFNLKYEIFPGGKLIVVTHNNRFGFRGVE